MPIKLSFIFTTNKMYCNIKKYQTKAIRNTSYVFLINSYLKGELSKFRKKYTATRNATKLKSEK